MRGRKNRHSLNFALFTEGGKRINQLVGNRTRPTCQHLASREQGQHLPESTYPQAPLDPEI